MKVNAIIQARCGSTRFPNKVFADINGNPLIWHVVNRLTYAKTIDQIVIATTVNEKDDQIEAWCKENNITCFRGSENDVSIVIILPQQHSPQMLLFALQQTILSKSLQLLIW